LLAEERLAREKGNLSGSSDECFILILLDS
jgi:hypothetical protein